MLVYLLLLVAPALGMFPVPDPSKWDSSLGELVGGDIVIPKGYDLRSWSRHALKDPKTKWEGGKVPYEISSIFNADQRAVILAGMKKYTEAFGDCIKFTPRAGEKDYLYIDHQQPGCFTYAGRVGGKQLVNLQRTGCIHQGVVMHELMHTLGFYHEQMRFDRDDYLIIHWLNINPMMWSQFKKTDPKVVTVFDEPYDYYSIMQYPWNAFAHLSILTSMEPKDKNIDKKDLGKNYFIGEFTDSDKKRIAQHYSCTVQ